MTGIVRGRVGSPAFLLAICLAASLLAGYPQNTVYACYTWGALLLILLFAEGTPARNWALPLGAFGAAVALGTLLASPQLLATQELVDQATRTFGPLSYETMFPAGWPRESLYHAFLVLMATNEFEIESPFGLPALLRLPFSRLSARRQEQTSVRGVMAWSRGAHAPRCRRAGRPTCAGPAECLDSRGSDGHNVGCGRVAGSGVRGPRRAAAG